MLRTKGKTERFIGIEVPVADRLPILEAYRAKARRVVLSHFRVLPDPADHPVLRVDAADE